MNSKQRGFTLLELLITITILAILINTGTQSMQWLSERTQASATRSNIERIFAIGRYTAVTENTIVTICPLNQSQKCVNDWSLPASIFRDPDNSLELKSQAQLIRSLALTSNGTLTPSNSFNGPRKHFQYRPDGAVRGLVPSIKILRTADSGPY